VAPGLLVALLLAATPKASLQPPEQLVLLDQRPVDEARVERVFRALSLREKVAQLLLAYPQLNSKTPVEVGGILFVGNTLRNLPAAKAKIESLKARAKVQPLVAVDMEGGKFNRMKGHPLVAKLPGAKALNAMSAKDIERWGFQTGSAMREVGLNFNLAPVFDIAPSGHMQRNGRAFSGQATEVEKSAQAFARGLLGADVIPVGKHFPGYGDVNADSDHEVAVAQWTPEKLEAQLAVFDHSRPVLGGVMMSNVAYAPSGPEPAILSRTLVERAHAMGFITVTDDVAVEALLEHVKGDPAEVLRRAFDAGNDLLLTTAPPDWDKGIDYIGLLLAHVQKDPARTAQAEASCRRLLRLKDRMGLLSGK
jgi:beta-N-acetylhexosaminidase